MTSNTEAERIGVDEARRKGEGRRVNCSLFSSSPHHCLSIAVFFLVLFACSTKASPGEYINIVLTGNQKGKERKIPHHLSLESYFFHILDGEEASHPALQKHSYVTLIWQLYNNSVPTALHQLLCGHQQQTDILQPPTRCSLCMCMQAPDDSDL